MQIKRIDDLSNSFKFNPKFFQGMSKESNKETILKAAYADLHKFGQNGEYEKALKAANRILGVAPDEEKALHCKLICLVQVSKFSEALQFIERNKLNDLVFEKAYCEYRLYHLDKALKTLDDSNIRPLPSNCKELRAQILYRLERFSDCFDLYKDIMRSTHDEYQNERKANMSAVLANLAYESESSLNMLKEDSYEVTYNNSCALLNKSNYVEAEKKLRACEKICREFFEEEGASEEEIRAEILNIRVQLGFCLQAQGKIKEAAVIYADVLKIKSRDPAITAVASNNTVVINKDQNLFDSKKRMRVAMSDSCEHKLLNRQKKVIALNNCLLSLYSGSKEQCQQLCDRLTQKYPDFEFESILIKCSQLVKDKKFKDAIEMLEKYSQIKSSNNIAAIFAIVQLLLLQGNKKSAIDMLLSIGETKYKPGVISALVTLMLGIDNKKGASEVLKEAVEWYRNSKDKSANLSEMWRQAAEFHLRGGEAKTAASSLEELLKTNPQDMKVLAQLVIAYAQFDRKKAQEISKRLPELGTLTTASEIDALEAANWMMSTKAVKKTANKLEPSPGTPGDIQKCKRKTKRKRKTKLPPNCNLAVPPDPERWLPKYERTGYRKKRDRRTKDVIKGSQGMASGAVDKYDMSKAQNLGKNSPAAQSHQELASGPRQQYRKGAQKKKKGRH